MDLSRSVADVDSEKSAEDQALAQVIHFPGHVDGLVSGGEFAPAPEHALNFDYHARDVALHARQVEFGL